MNKITNVIGIDPGLAFLGWGVLAIEDGVSHRARSKSNKKVYHLGHGVIETSSKDSLGHRLMHIEQSIDAIFSRYDISVLAFEQQFFVRNVTSGLQVAHALGVILLYAAKQGLSTISFTPKEIKLQVTGSATAKKDTIEKFICQQLNLDMVELHHASDALGAALSYYYQTLNVISNALKY